MQISFQAGDIVCTAGGDIFKAGGIFCTAGADVCKASIAEISSLLQVQMFLRHVNIVSIAGAGNIFTAAGGRYLYCRWGHS